MTEKNIYLNTVFDNCKSFYNKAYYKYIDYLNSIYLYSYNTHVLTFNKSKQCFEDVYYCPHSRTTDRHIREFKKQIENKIIQ